MLRTLQTEKYTKIQMMYYYIFAIYLLLNAFNKKENNENIKQEQKKFLHD